MNVALRRPMTVPEFLAWEERQELRYEFDGFQPVAMPGGTRVHAAIEMNLAAALTMPSGQFMPTLWGQSEDRGCRQDSLPRRLRHLHAGSQRIDRGAGSCRGL